MFNIYTMLYLALKKVRMVSKSLFVRFPPSDKKSPAAKIPLSLSYLLIWKTMILILIEDKMKSCFRGK